MAPDTEPSLAKPTSNKRMWIVVGVLIAIAFVARIIFTGFFVNAVERFSAWNVAGPSSSGSPGCSDPVLVPGYDEVVRAGYSYECVPDIPDSEDMLANSDYEIAGLTDSISKTISIVDTDGVETFTQALETGHALAGIYQDSVAQGFYLAHAGLDHWYESSFDDYFDSGSESFAETYAVCSLGVRAIRIPFTANTLLLPYGDVVEYKIGSCETLNKTLDMMKNPS